MGTNGLKKALNDSVTSAIDNSKKEVDEKLKEIEENYRRTLSAHISHHKYMMDMANEQGNYTLAARHKLMIEVYQSILDRFSLSNSKSSYL